MTTSTLAKLTTAGHDLEARFRELAGNTRSPEFETFASDLHLWLTDCVGHGRFLPAGTPERRTLQGQVDYWTSRLLQAGHALPKFDRLDAFDPTAGLLLPKEAFPYYGLLAVTEVGTERFFGRDEQIKEYVAHLEYNEALLIQSESGGGKSSVAMAGVIPELRRRHPDWLVAPRLTPGAHPHAALGDALGAELGLTPAASAGAPPILAALGTRSLLIFIDQLEELLTVCTDESEQATFCALLAALVGSGRVRLLTTLRSDHYDRLASSQACRPLFVVLTAANSVKTLPPMSFEQIRSVILKPAQAVGLRYVPASLVDRLANETANLAGGLPRLQFALQRLWELRPNNEQDEPLDLINETSFAKLPNVREALGTVAQGVFETLSVDDQRACERLMLELTLLDDQLEVPLRRRRFEDDLLAVLAGAKLATEARALELVQKFVDQRLLVRTGEGGARQIEVAHESLFRYWSQFQNWINSDKARSRLKDVRQIARDALQWKRNASPDYLMLKGVPLENALRYRDENWLDAASRRYCDACEVVVRAQDEAEREREQQRVAAEDEARRVRDRALAAEEDAVQRQRAFRVRLFVGAGSAVLLAFAVWMYTLNLDSRRVAATNAFAALFQHLDPLEALDLAYALEKNSPGEFVAPLAHALDRLTGSEVVAKRDAGADFSPSGRALTQLVRDGNKLKVRIVPIEADGSLWPVPATIDIVEDAGADGSLAALDVGPPIATAAGKRLVVMSFVNPLDPQGSVTFKKLVAYAITRGAAAPVRRIDRPYPDFTSQASDVSFDASGEGAALASVRYPRDGAPQDEVILLRKKPAGGMEVVKVDDSQATHTNYKDNRSVVTAIAYGEAPASSLSGAVPRITGRLDGSVFCGDNTRIEGPDRSPVMRLRAAGTEPAFVALHASNKLVVGRCGVPNAMPQVVEEGLTSPQSLIFRSVTNTGGSMGAGFSPAKSGLQLSFTDDRKLCSITWPAQSVPSGTASECWVPNLAVDQAVPVFAETGAFLALPDRSRSWLVTLIGGSPNRRSNIADVKGVPVGLPPDVSNRRADGALQSNRSPAASPNQQYLARIAVANNAARVERQLRAGEWLDVATGGKRPIAVTLNDRGVLAVLEEGRGVALVQPGGTRAVRTQLGFDGACLKLTPDGHGALVAGRGGETTIVKVDAAGTPPTNAQKMQILGRGAPLTACAVGNDGAAVSGFSDGTVIYARPAGKPVELSELVQFRLPSGAQDVSIDATGRFVAVLGKRAERICLAGAPGYPVRIWDLSLPRSSFPVASGCLPNDKVMAIGPLQLRAVGHWVLPVFEESGSSARRFEYDCLACVGEGSNASATNALIVSLAKKNFSPKPLKAKDISASYGIEP